MMLLAPNSPKHEPCRFRKNIHLNIADRNMNEINFRAPTQFAFVSLHGELAKSYIYFLAKS